MNNIEFRPWFVGEYTSISKEELIAKLREAVKNHKWNLVAEETDVDQPILVEVKVAR